VPYFLKQAQGTERDSIGGTRHIRPLPGTPRRRELEAVVAGAGSKTKAGAVIELPYLDGKQWAQFPEVAR
jgi:hypothetical protein